MAKNTEMVGGELIDKLIPAKDKNLSTIQFGQKYYNYLSNHTATNNQQVTIDWGYGPTTYFGYWKDFDWLPITAPTPGPANNGSISPENIFGTDLEITGLTVSDNTNNSWTGPDYLLQILIRGSHQPQDTIQRIDVNNVGIVDTASADAFVPYAAQDGMTQWWWSITEAQYLTIVAAQRIDVRLETTAWYNPSIDQITLAYFDAGTNERMSFREFRHRADYNQYHVSVGSMTNGLIGGNKIAAIETYHNDGANTDTDNIYLSVLGVDLPDTTFGAIRFPGLNPLTPSSVGDKRRSQGGTGPETVWEWNIDKMSPWGNPQHALSLSAGRYEIEIDERPFVSDRVMTIHTHGDNVSYGWKGAWVDDGNSPDLGHLTDYSIGAEGIVHLAIFANLGASPNYTMLVAFEDADDNLLTPPFEYIELEGIGRFYADNAARWHADSGFREYTQFQWQVSQQMYDDMPTSGTMNVEVKI